MIPEIRTVQASQGRLVNYYPLSLVPPSMGNAHRFEAL